VPVGNGSSSYDAIVVGAGHNGLTAAAYLAAAGRRVVVLERKPMVGGAAVTEEPLPGYRFSSCASMAPLPRRIVRDLGLKRHGFEALAMSPTLWSPDGEGGQGLLLSETAARSKTEIARFSDTDARRYAEFLTLMRRLAAALQPQLWKAPPEMIPAGTREGLEFLRLGGRLRLLGRRDLSELLRIPFLSLSDFLSDWFETDLLRSMLAAGALTGSLAGPISPGTASLLLFDFCTAGSGPPGPRMIPRGGTAALSEALAAAARSRGAEVRTGAEVEQIVVRGGAARGVVLSGGEEIAARVVVSNADPHRTFLRLLDPVHLDPEFLQRIRNLRMTGAVAVVHIALEGLPDFTSLPERIGRRALAGRIRIAPGTEYLERAFDDAKHGRCSNQPFLEVVIPSLTDPSLAPEGGHVMSVLVQFAPYHLREGNWEDHRERLADTVVEILSRHAPDLPGRIHHRYILTPKELEQLYGLTDGHIYHVEHCLDQLFLLRPLPECSRYRTPLRNLYLCGAGTHPGGGISGLCGRNAAGRILADWKPDATR
jgi:phytoene dehydrogenase-like protein